MAQEQQGWEVTLTVSTEIYFRQFTEEAVFGAYTDTTDGYDEGRDEPAPAPPSPPCLDVYFYHPDWPSDIFQGGRVYKDLMALDNDIQWPLTINYNPGAGGWWSDVTIEWSGVENIPEDYELLLLDAKTGNVLADLREDTSYKFRASVPESGTHTIYEFTIWAVIPEVTVTAQAAFNNATDTVDLTATAECKLCGTITSGSATYEILNTNIAGSLTYNSKTGRWESLGIDVSRLDEGTYKVRVTITDAEGHKGTGETTFRIVRAPRIPIVVLTPEQKEAIKYAKEVCEQITVSRTVNIEKVDEAFNKLVENKLMSKLDFTFSPETAKNFLERLQQVYGPTLEKYPTPEGRIWLLYMLYR